MSKFNLERKIEVLWDIEEIRKTKSRYWCCIDRKIWDELGDIFTEDATADYGEAGFPKGRQKILDYLKAWEGYDYVVTSHTAHQSVVEITGDHTATALFTFSYYRADTISEVRRDGLFYEDEFVKECDGKWRIKKLKIIPICSEYSLWEDRIHWS